MNEAERHPAHMTVRTIDRPYSHYFRESPSFTIDVYRILQMFEVSDPCIQHALKKVLAAGKRGAKDTEKDVQEAIDALLRWQEMRREETDAWAPEKP